MNSFDAEEMDMIVIIRSLVQPWCDTIPYCILTDHGRILYTRDLSNYQQDVDTFLYNLKCIAPVQHSEPLHTPVPSSSKIHDAIRCFIVILNSQTVVIYIPG